MGAGRTANPMEKNLFSPHWYRVANLKPRLRKHAQLHRHNYRGTPWYVLQDHSSGRFHRFSPAAYQLIGLMDGRHSMDQVWQHAARAMGEGSLTQAQAIQLLGQLYKADVLIADVSADTRELFLRQSSSARKQKIQKWKSPLSIRVPLFDPERFITATLPLVRWIFTPWGFLLWLLIVGSSVVTAFIHWPELTRNLSDRIFAGQNILVLLVTFPLIKALHEFGHAYAARARGGEVHEMGIMFLILMPIPYVDATSSSAFPSRWSRALVGAAGMLTELLLASLALHVWLSTESGFVSAVMFNTMLIAGVSTILFNANPLIRFDGYYILADLIEIPNLGSRSTRYLGYLIQRYLFGVEGLQSPANAPGEEKWFVLYGIGSFIYRLFLISFIVFLLADKYFIIGVILALWAVYTMAILPIIKQVRFVMTNKRLKGKRGRAITVSALMLASMAGAMLIPLPLVTIAEGVVWADKESRVHVESPGFVKTENVKPGDSVRKGDILYVCSSIELEAKKQRLIAQLAELQAQYDTVSGTTQAKRDRVQVELVKVQLNATRAQLAQVEIQLKQLVVRSPVSGKFIPFNNRSMENMFLNRGEILGVITQSKNAMVRVIVPQSRIGLVRQQTDSISVKVVDALNKQLTARLSREVPTASQDLPSAALSVEGGGDIATNPGSANTSSGPSALQSWFQFDIEIDRHQDKLGLGERIYARFHHGYEPVGVQIYRVVRQTFLNRFNV